jgi:tripeptide aminopeptidase
MNVRRLIDRTIKIQSIPAPTFDEAARASWVYREFQELGFEAVEQDPVGNVYCRIAGGNQPPLVITAHMDTVFSLDVPLQLLKTSERIVGPGIGDNSIAVAALFEIAQDFHSRQLPSDIWLVANVGEEGLGNLVGMRQVVSRFEGDVSAYLVIEGMAFGHIYHQGLPVRRVRISVEGPGGHSWIHKGRISANHTLLRMGSEISQLSLSDSPKDSLNIGIIHGGSSINTIASHSHLEIDLRSEDPAKLEQLTRKVQNITDRFIQPEITIVTKTIGERPSGGLAPDHPLVIMAQNALTSVGVATPTLDAGSTDASAPLSHGYPAVCVGITKGGDAHTPAEFIELEPIPVGYQSIHRLIELVLGIK